MIVSSQKLPVQESVLTQWGHQREKSDGVGKKTGNKKVNEI